MGLMARDARSLFSVGHVDIGMAPDARCGRVFGRVRHVAAGAYRVRRRRFRRESDLLAMTADARGLPTGDEVVRLMAADARFVAAGRGPGGLDVTRRARIERRKRGVMAAMAIEAARRVRMRCVLRRSLAMAARAIGHDDRRRLVDLVALGALERRVPHHGMALALGLGVAADARRLGKIGRERVARQTRGRRRPEAASVRDGGLLGVAVAAHGRSRVLEPVALEVVAGAACDIGLSDVSLMSRARSKLSPGGGHGFGRGPAGRARPQGKHRGSGGQDRAHRKGDPDKPSQGHLHGPTP
jgi:hypothetical protein